MTYLILKGEDVSYHYHLYERITIPWAALMKTEQGDLHSSRGCVNDGVKGSGIRVWGIFFVRITVDLKWGGSRPNATRHATS